MEIKITIIILSLICLSCGRIMLYSTYRITKPKKESFEKQKKYLLKKGVDTSYMFTFDDKYVGNITNNYFPLNESDTNGFRIIQSRFYNSEKKVLLNWSSCYGYVQEYFKPNCTIKSINSELYGKNDTTFPMEKILLYVNEQKRFKNLINQKSDLYIVSFWAKWLGTPSLNTLKKIEEIKDSSSCNIIHIKINYGNMD